MDVVLGRTRYLTGSSIRPVHELRQLGAGVDAQLGERIVDVGFHRMQGKVQLLRDKAVRRALRDEVDDRELGVSEAVPGDYSTSLLARADKALYQAKNAGRNCTRVILHNTENPLDSASQPLINALLPSTQPDLIES